MLKILPFITKAHMDNYIENIVFYINLITVLLHTVCHNILYVTRFISKRDGTMDSDPTAMIFSLAHYFEFHVCFPYTSLYLLPNICILFSCVKSRQVSISNQYFNSPTNTNPHKKQKKLQQDYIHNLKMKE